MAILKISEEPEDKIINMIETQIKKNNFNVNQKMNLSRDRILHFAAYHVKPKIVSFLVEENGATTDIKNDFGFTPLDLIEKRIETEQDEEIRDKLIQIERCLRK